MDRLVEADAARVHRCGAFTGPLHRAGHAGLIDPLHGGAAVHIAAPVDVGRLRQESVDRARCGGVVRVGLLQHGRLDGLAQVDAGDRGGFHAALLIGLRRKCRHRGWAPSCILCHENHQAVARAGENTFPWVCREHLVDDVHGSAASHRDPGTDLHNVTRRNRSGEVDVADVGSHAVGRRPLRGTRVCRLVDPLQHTATRNTLGARVENICRSRHETQRDGRRLHGTTA